MTVTPPPQLPSTHPPPTPRYGPMIDSCSPQQTRRTTRSATKFVFESNGGLSNGTFSPPPSGEGSPAKRARRAVDCRVVRRSPGGDVIMSGDEVESDADSSSDLMMRAQGTTIDNTHMLPTPAKTPRKGAEVPAQALRSTARVLFPPHSDAANELTPTISERRTRRRKDVASANGMDCGVGEKVEIFTDSHERIPELDATEGNPFYQPRKRAQQPSQGSGGYATRGNTRRAAELEKALKRDDGMVYTFRGRKFFRKFDDETDADADGETRRVTRSSLKPRLLFPTEEQKREREARDATAAQAAQDEDDEEALTDIDDDALNELDPKRDMETDSDADILTSPPQHGTASRSTAAKAFAQPSPDSDGATRTTEVTFTPRSFKPADHANGAQGSPPATPVAPIPSPLSPETTPSTRTLRSGASGFGRFLRSSIKSFGQGLKSTVQDRSTSTAKGGRWSQKQHEKDGSASSPFDLWNRAKAVPSSAGSAGKGKKRGKEPADESHESPVKKRAKRGSKTVGSL